MQLKRDPGRLTVTSGGYILRWEVGRKKKKRKRQTNVYLLELHISDS